MHNMHIKLDHLCAVKIIAKIMIKPLGRIRMIEFTEMRGRNHKTRLQKNVTKKRENGWGW